MGLLSFIRRMGRDKRSTISTPLSAEAREKIRSFRQKHFTE